MLKLTFFHLIGSFQLSDTSNYTMIAGYTPNFINFGRSAAELRPFEVALYRVTTIILHKANNLQIRQKILVFAIGYQSSICYWPLVEVLRVLRHTDKRHDRINLLSKSKVRKIDTSKVKKRTPITQFLLHFRKIFFSIICSLEIGLEVCVKRIFIILIR